MFTVFYLVLAVLWQSAPDATDHEWAFDPLYEAPNRAGLYLEPDLGVIKWLGTDLNWSGSIPLPVESCSHQDLAMCLRFGEVMYLPINPDVALETEDGYEVTVQYGSETSQFCESDYAIVHNRSSFASMQYIFSPSLGLVEMRIDYHDGFALSHYRFVLLSGTPIRYHELICNAE